MESPARPSLLIVVPVHEDDGWTTHSPGETAKARLENKSPNAKSPEDLKAACERADAKARALHDLHLDAVRRRAQRDLERVREAERRRLRNEAAEKQRILDKATALEKKAVEKKEAMEREATEKRERREALRQAFFASRASMAAATLQREAAYAQRIGEAASKRTKLLQATVHKANYEVKHALAVATAVKEKERAAKEIASANLGERLAAASSRRIDLLESPRSIVWQDHAAAAAKSPGSESARVVAGSEAAKQSGRARARHVATMLNGEAVALELKRKALADAMSKALAARDARLEATVLRAAAYKEKAARAKSTLEARQASVQSLAHQIAEKGQAAEVRRLLHLKAPLHKKMSPSCIEIETGKRAGAVAPAALVARLSHKPTLLPSELLARLQSATARRERILFDKLTALASRVVRAESAKGARGAALEARKAALARKELATVEAVRAAKTARTATAIEMNRRVGAASAKRAAASFVALGFLLTKAEQRERAAATRSAALLARGAAQRRRAAAFKARREAQDEARAKSAAVAAARSRQASVRRASILSARVARAKLSAMSRSTAVKLTAVKDGVQLHVVAAGEEKPTTDKAGDQAAGDEAADDEAAVVIGAAAEAAPVAPEEAELSRGVVGRVFGRIFGF